MRVLKTVVLKNGIVTGSFDSDGVSMRECEGFSLTVSQIGGMMGGTSNIELEGCVVVDRADITDDDWFPIVGTLKTLTDTERHIYEYDKPYFLHVRLSYTLTSGDTTVVSKIALITKDI